MEMQNAAKAVERGNFIEINAYIKKKREKAALKHLTL